MLKQRNLAVVLILALGGMLTPISRTDAGTIAGKLYETDGMMQITYDTITIQVLDSAGGPTPYGGSYASGAYAITIDPAKLAPADKTVTFRVSRGGQVTRIISGLAGNVQAPQTVHITVPRPTLLISPPPVPGVAEPCPVSCCDCGSAHRRGALFRRSRCR